LDLYFYSASGEKMFPFLGALPFTKKGAFDSAVNNLWGYYVDSDGVIVTAAYSLNDKRFLFPTDGDGGATFGVWYLNSDCSGTMYTRGASLRQATNAARSFLMGQDTDRWIYTHPQTKALSIVSTGLSSIPVGIAAISVSYFESSGSGSAQCRSGLFANETTFYELQTIRTLPQTWGFPLSMRPE
jgi:hypothetical protein